MFSFSFGRVGSTRRSLGAPSKATTISPNHGKAHMPSQGQLNKWNFRSGFRCFGLRDATHSMHTHMLLHLRTFPPLAFSLPRRPTASACRLVAIKTRNSKTNARPSRSRICSHICLGVCLLWQWLWRWRKNQRVANGGTGVFRVDFIAVRYLQ